MPRQGGWDPLGPLNDAMRIAVPLVINQRNIDAEKEMADKRYMQQKDALLQQANQAQTQVATQSAWKIFEGSVNNADLNDPAQLMKVKASATNFEKILGKEILPRDETGEYAFLRLAKPEGGITEYQKESLSLKSQLAEQARIDRDEARKDRMALAGQASADRRDSLDLKRDMLEEQKTRNLRGEQGTKPKQGYMWNEDKSAQVPIPGTEADRKQKLLYSKEKYAFESVTTDLDKMINEATALLDHKGLPAITGRRSYIPNILNQDAQDAQARLDSLKSQVFVNTLNNMRKQSATGGAVGNVTEREGDKLEATIASLKNAQSEKEMRAALKRIVDYSSTIKTKLGNAFSTWDDIMNPGGGAPVTEKNLDIKNLGNDELMKKLGIGK